MIHFLHQYGEWEEAGNIMAVPKNLKEILFSEEDLVKIGELFMLHCMRCDKVKVRLAYD